MIQMNIWNNLTMCKEMTGVNRMVNDPNEYLEQFNYV